MTVCLKGRTTNRCPLEEIWPILIAKVTWHFFFQLLRVSMLIPQSTSVSLIGYSLAGIILLKAIIPKYAIHVSWDLNQESMLAIHSIHSSSFSSSYSTMRVMWHSIIVHKNYIWINCTSGLVHVGEDHLLTIVISDNRTSIKNLKLTCLFNHNASYDWVH